MFWGVARKKESEGQKWCTAQEAGGQASKRLSTWTKQRQPLSAAFTFMNACRWLREKPRILSVGPSPDTNGGGGGVKPAGGFAPRSSGGTRRRLRPLPAVGACSSSCRNARACKKFREEGSGTAHAASAAILGAKKAQVEQ